MDTAKNRAFSVISLWSWTLTAGEKESPSEGGIPGIIYKDGLLRISVKNKSFKKIMDEVTPQA